MDKQQGITCSLWNLQHSGERKTVWRKKENCDHLLRILISMSTLQNVCACLEFTQREQAHLALSDNTTGLLASKEGQNFPLLKIQQ